MNLRTKLAAALLRLGDVPYEDAKLMTAEQIISLYEWDHYPVRRADGGPDEPWNLTPRLRSAHRIKTTTVDQPELAKGKRIRRKWAEHKARMKAKDHVEEEGADRSEQPVSALRRGQRRDR